MKVQADKSPENKNKSGANDFSQKQNESHSAFQITDNRPQAITQRKLLETMDNSPRTNQLRAIQNMADNSPRAKQAAQLQAMAHQRAVQTLQRMSLEDEEKKEEPVQGKSETAQLTAGDQPPTAANNTGLPDNLKTGIENLSGYSMNDVKVHYNSDKPAQLNAHAYAQGADIHLASGQEKHLPHEAWHVVQQKQGRVKPTMQMKGKVNINNDKSLEKEADAMGAKALQLKNMPYLSVNSGKLSNFNSGLGEGIVQGVWEDSGTGVLKWSELRDGVRWYVVDGTTDMYYLIEGELPEAHASLYKANEGFGHIKPYSRWMSENDFDKSEKFSIEDLEIVDTSSDAERLWDNMPAKFKTKNLDKNTQKPKGKDSTYVVGARGMVRFKEDKSETLSHPDRHICFVDGGSFGGTRSKGFKLKAGAKQKIVVDSSYSGIGLRLLLGESAEQMIVSLTPVQDYRACDFNYNSDTQKAENFHVGHPVK